MASSNRSRGVPVGLGVIALGVVTVLLCLVAVQHSRPTPTSADTTKPLRLHTTDPVPNPGPTSASTSASPDPSGGPSTATLPAGPLTVRWIGGDLTRGRGASGYQHTFKRLMSVAIARQHDLDPSSIIGTVDRLSPLVQAGTFPADVFVVQLGNGFTAGMPATDLRTDLDAVFQSIRTSNPDAVLVCTGQWASAGDAALYDSTIRTSCTASGGTFVPLSGVFDEPGSVGPAGKQVYSGVIAQPEVTSRANDANDQGHERIAQTLLEAMGVVARAQTSTPTPGVTGTPGVGQVLTAKPGHWDDGADLSYQWSVGGKKVDGATDTTYTPVSADVGKKVTVTVTGRETGFAAVSRTSNPTKAVAAVALTPTPTPSVSGTPKVGSPLTAVAGTWASGATLTYQWLSNGSPISGATSTTYTPDAGQSGRVVTVAVTGAKTGFTTVTVKSTNTTAVAPGTLTTTPTPTVTGTSMVGKTLQSVTGTWDSGVTFRYQWMRDGFAISGATGSAYTLHPADAQHTVSVVVTGSKTGYTPVPRTSAGTYVQPGIQSHTPSPRITGQPRVGRTLTASPGPKDADATVVYTWLLDGTAIDQHSHRLKVTRAMLGKRIQVTVTFKETGYSDASATSSAVGPVTG